MSGKNLRIFVKLAEIANVNALLVRILKEKGIGSGIHYPIPIHKQPLYRKLGYYDVLPVAERMAQQVVSLPIHPGVTKKDLDYISTVIKEVFQ